MKFGMRILEGIKRLQTEQHVKDERARITTEYEQQSKEWSEYERKQK